MNPMSEAEQKSLDSHKSSILAEVSYQTDLLYMIYILNIECAKYSIYVEVYVTKTT